MSIILIILIVGTAFCLALTRPYYYIVLYCLLGSSYDSLGIVNYFNGIIKYYSFFMQTILLIALLRALIHFYYRKKIKVEKQLIIYLVLFNIGILLSTVLYGIVEAGKYNIVLQSIYNLASFSGTIAIIWISYNDNPVLKHIFKRLIVVQAIIAILIIYLPSIGINWLEFINGKNYLNSDEYNYKVVTPFNVKELLKNKYYFNKTAQFHNANAVGFYGGTLAFIFICDLYKLKKNLILSSLGGIGMGIILWLHNGMRGIIIGIFLAVIYNIIAKKKIAKKIVYIYLMGGVVLAAFIFIPIVKDIASYIVVRKDSTAVQGRLDLLVNAVSFLKSNFWLGNGGLIGNLIAEDIDPHQLPVRISVLFGVPMGIIITFIIYVTPIVYYIKANKVSLYSLGFVLILWMISITNNYTCVVLFWLCFAEAFNEMLRVQNEI